MKKFLFLLVTLLASFQIYAHGPTPQKVQETITINASVEKVWAVVKDFCNIQKWHPAVEKTTCEKKVAILLGHLSYRLVRQSMRNYVALTKIYLN